MASSTRFSRSARADDLTAGGPAGNERLTAATGVVLLVVLAAVGVTIVRIGQLLNVHMFLGVALIAPVALKMASTGYRFMRYYTSEPRYRSKGPPALALRLIAPVVVASTVVVLASGVVLLLAGPASRNPWILIHKASFFVWGAFTAVHVLGHLPDLPRALATRRTLLADGQPMPGGRSGRALALSATLLVGAALGVASIAEFGPWTHHLQ